MSKIILLVLISIFLVYILYKLYSIFYFLQIRKKLKGQDLASFKRLLGENYLYKVINTENTKFKWMKGWVVIKAIFDSHGQLADSEHSQYDFISPVTELFFAKDA